MGDGWRDVADVRAREAVTESAGGAERAAGGGRREAGEGRRGKGRSGGWCLPSSPDRNEQCSRKRCGGMKPEGAHDGRDHGDTDTIAQRRSENTHEKENGHALRREGARVEDSPSRARMTSAEVQPAVADSHASPRLRVRRCPTEGSCDPRRGIGAKRPSRGRFRGSAKAGSRPQWRRTRLQLRPRRRPERRSLLATSVDCPTWYRPGVCRIHPPSCAPSPPPRAAAARAPREASPLRVSQRSPGPPHPALHPRSRPLLRCHLLPPPPHHHHHVADEEPVPSARRGGSSE